MTEYCPRCGEDTSIFRDHVCGDRNPALGWVDFARIMNWKFWCRSGIKYGEVKPWPKSRS